MSVLLKIQFHLVSGNLTSNSVTREADHMMRLKAVFFRLNQRLFRRRSTPDLLIKNIASSVVGERCLFSTPFGEKPLVYADYTASGRSLSFIEECIGKEVLPYYANTHTEANFSGAKTTALREEARQVIKEVVNADQSYALIFCGSGSTSAIVKLIDILNLRIPPELDQRYQLSDRIPKKQRPVVFIGPYEHHSNELPWRESIVELVTIPLCERGNLDMQFLENALQSCQDRNLLIGSFSAASNVTGIKTRVKEVTQLLHRYGALSFWDYAAAAPYVSIDACGKGPQGEEGAIDALFISPHKFIGGPGTPGVLVVKRDLLTNRVPVVPGGGTVDFVTPQDHQYIPDQEQREEGGTPAIIESIRAGLVFKLQQQVGCETIEQREREYVKRAINAWSEIPNIRILGSRDADRLAIISFMIEHNDRYLHYGFVVALLNDLFGIQARGGCSCAGPYGHLLLDIGAEQSRQYTEEIDKGNNLLKPGWVRVNFNYFIDRDTFEYVVNAIKMIAEHGWKLLPYYQYQASGTWLYQGDNAAAPSVFLNFDPLLSNQKKQRQVPPEDLKRFTDMALTELQKNRADTPTFSLSLSDHDERLRWFTLPQECLH